MPTENTESRPSADELADRTFASVVNILTALAHVKGGRVSACYGRTTTFSFGSLSGLATTRIKVVSGDGSDPHCEVNVYESVDSSTSVTKALLRGRALVAAAEFAEAAQEIVKCEAGRIVAEAQVAAERAGGAP